MLPNFLRNNYSSFSSAGYNRKWLMPYGEYHELLPPDRDDIERNEDTVEDMNSDEQLSEERTNLSEDSKFSQNTYISLRHPTPEEELSRLVHEIGCDVQALIEEGKKFVSHPKQPSAYTMFRCALEIEQENAEAQANIDSILTDVDAFDNEIISALHQIRNEICRDLDSLDMKTALKELYKLNVHNSCAIEGNLLTFEQVRKLLDKRFPLSVDSQQLMEMNKDEREVVGAARGLCYVLNQVESFSEINIKSVLQLHKYVYEYVKDGNNPAGELFFQPRRWVPRPVGDSESLESHLVKFFEWLWFQINNKRSASTWTTNSSRPNIDGVSLAALAHHFLVCLHPFADGNGRSSRLLIDWVLLHYGFPPAVFPEQHRDQYIACLKLANCGELRPFIRFVAQCVRDTMIQILTYKKSQETQKSPVNLFSSTSSSEGGKLEVARGSSFHNGCPPPNVSQLSDFVFDHFVEIENQMHTYNHRPQFTVESENQKSPDRDENNGVRKLIPKTPSSSSEDDIDWVKFFKDAIPYFNDDLIP